MVIVIIGSICIAFGIVFNEWTAGMLLTPDGEINNVTIKLMIWGLDLVFVFSGVIIIKTRDRIRAKKREIFFAVITFIIFIISVEVCMRGLYFVKKIIGSTAEYSEDRLGWRTPENASLVRNKKGYGEVSFNTSQHGFRVFGDISTEKVKIFVVGDSYTLGATVSDGETYYDYLKNSSGNIEVFAYGTGGYGSLQEYMILDEYFNLIQPDLILWQFCNNDLINNSYELESRSHYANNHNIRPYLDYKTGKITLLFPRQTSGWIYKISRHSYLLKYLYIKLNVIEADVVGTIENYLTEDHPLAIETVRTTSKIMEMAKKRAGGVPIVAFPVDSDRDNIDYLPWSNRAYADIARKHSIYFIEHLPEVLDEAQKKGVVIDAPLNAHWNRTGHALAGKTILDYLIEHDLLKKHPLQKNNSSNVKTAKHGLPQAAFH